MSALESVVVHGTRCHFKIQVDAVVAFFNILGVEWQKFRAYAAAMNGFINLFNNIEIIIIVLAHLFSMNLDKNEYE